MGNSIDKINKYAAIKMFMFLLGALLFIHCSNDDGNDSPDLPQLKIEDFARSEGNTNTTFKFFLRLSESLNADLTVDFQTIEGSAKNGEDFISVEGQTIIPAGSTMDVIEVTIVTDTLYEVDESFSVFITADPNLVNIVKASAEGLIVNDDSSENMSEDGYVSPLNYTGYDRIWQDEFDGMDLDQNSWTFEEGTGSNGWGNNELQYYRKGSNNTKVSNGKLEIIAKQESFGGSNYTSARIITMDKFDFRYGRVDIRAKLPFGQGIWPALWMLGSNFKSIGWPRCGEIDIMELVGHEPDVVHGTAHWSHQGNHASAGGFKKLNVGLTYSDQFNVFSILWDDRGITWLMNDVEYYRLSTTDDELSELHNSCFFIFNVAVGGNWPGSPNATTTFPQRMTVDYIRVFQKE